MGHFSIRRAGFLCRSSVFLAFSLAACAWQSGGLCAESWTDSKGNYSVEAKFVAIEGDLLVLRKANGKSVKIPLLKLNAESLRQAQQFALGQRQEPIAPLVANLRKANDLEALAKSQRSAARALHLYEAFLTQPDLDLDQRQKALKRLEKWQKRAATNQFRWGRRWATVEQIHQSLQKEERLLKEAHRLMEIGNDEMARERFEDASDTNREGVRADFYLGVLHALIGRYPKGAVERFSLCVKRLERAPDRLRAARRSNLVAALNNRAICYLRRGKHVEAMKDWDKAIELAPLTPELVQNLGYYAQLSSMVRGWGISRAISRRITDQYAKIAVTNQSAAFSEYTGFLFIPYIDAPVMPDFEDIQMLEEREITAEDLLNVNNKAENDLRVIAWATGVAMDQHHLIMSRHAAQGALGFWLRRDGHLVRTTPGKIVAVSGAYDLALVRFEGLGAEVVPLETEPSKRATDIRVVSFSEPGLLADGAIVSKGTVIDLQTTYVPLGKQYLTKRVQRTSLGQDSRLAHEETETIMQTMEVPIGTEYVTALIHDVQVNPGGEGAPLLNTKGQIIGIDVGVSNSSLRKKGWRSAINHTEVRLFLKSTGMSFPAIDQHQSGVVGDIDQFVQAMADSSVFQIAVVGRVPRLSWSDRIGEVRGIRTSENWNAFEDPWCIRCDGQGQIACPERGCVEGHISHKETSIVGRFPGTGKPIYESVWIREPCHVCNANGFLTCPHCGGKRIEPLIH